MMRKLKSLLCLLVCFCLLLCLAGCSTKTPAAPSAPETTVPAPTEPAEPSAAELYQQALEPLRNAQNLLLDITTKKTITTAAESFELVSTQELTLVNIGSDGFTAAMEEALEIGEYRDEFTEYYENGTLFVNIYNSGRFQGAMEEADFLSRFVPVAMLEDSLYGSIHAEEADAITTLVFSEPSAPESWALPENADFISAGGSAKLQNGMLTKTTYTMEYTQGSTTVSMEVSAKAELYDGDAPQAPPEPERYKPVDAIDGPRLYDTAILYLYGAQNATADSTQTILSEAAAYTLTSQAAINYSGTGSSHVSDLQYNVTSVDASMNVGVFTQAEHFQDGIYTYSELDGEPEPDSSVSASTMLDYLQSFYHDNILALEYIHGITVEDLGGLLYLEMQMTEQWGRDMADHTAGMIFEDPQTLNNLAAAYETDTDSYYMVLDAATGFPLSAGTAYRGIHTIDGEDYALSMEIAQTYRLADPSSYEQVTGTPMTEAVPETQATPLLYQVSGASGEQMYLMGTIHVGDARTAHLPQEVYDALSASDTLAVEADVTNLDALIAQDPELAAQIALAYVNTDGTTMETLLEEDIYQKAVKLMKASGSYSASAETMKPGLWSTSIENLYLSLSGLPSEHGMDMRLLTLAQEQGLNILEIESVLSQIEILSGFSMELQLLLLEQAVGFTVADYRSDVRTLYELWCAGDEAALRSQMAQEPAGLSPEELVIYEEYLDTVIIQRNTHMLESATAYLESGDTVFFAVGIAHLLQENGLVDTLRAAGYTVEQIQYA